MDDRPSMDGAPARERAFNAPAVILIVIAVLVAIHIARVTVLTEEGDLEALLDFAFVPLRFLLWISPDALAGTIEDIAARLPADEAARDLSIARYLVAEGAGRPYTLLTYAFLHGDWGHLAVNCASLLAFGAPLARRLGTGRTLLFLVLTAIAGIALHFALHPQATAPVIGASAAASGVMAGAVRFVFSPFGFSDGSSARAPVRPIAVLARDRRPMLFVFFWFLLNLGFGIGAAPLGIAPGGIAWEAHIGGFVAGFFLMPLMDPRPRPAAA